MSEAAEEEELRWAPGDGTSQTPRGAGQPVPSQGGTAQGGGTQALSRGARSQEGLGGCGCCSPRPSWHPSARYLGGAGRGPLSSGSPPNP